MLSLLSVRTLFKVENEFSHMAVDAPNVSACLKAVITLGIASSALWKVFTIRDIVQV